MRNISTARMIALIHAASSDTFLKKDKNGCCCTVQEDIQNCPFCENYKKFNLSVGRFTSRKHRSRNGKSPGLRTKHKNFLPKIFTNTLLYKLQRIKNKKAEDKSRQKNPPKSRAKKNLIKNNSRINDISRINNIEKYIDNLLNSSQQISSQSSNDDIISTECLLKHLT